MTADLFQKIESVARIKKLSVNQFFLRLAKAEIEKSEYVKLLSLLGEVGEK